MGNMQHTNAKNKNKKNSPPFHKVIHLETSFCLFTSGSSVLVNGLLRSINKLHKVLARIQTFKMTLKLHFYKVLYDQKIVRSLVALLEHLLRLIRSAYWPCYGIIFLSLDILEESNVHDDI